MHSDDVGRGAPAMETLQQRVCDKSKGNSGAICVTFSLSTCCKGEAEKQIFVSGFRKKSFHYCTEKNISISVSQQCQQEHNQFDLLCKWCVGFNNDGSSV